MDWLLRAGWMAWPLGACAIAALALFLERWFALSSRRVLPPVWKAQMIAALKSGEEPQGCNSLATGRMVVAVGAADDRRRARVQEAG